MQNKAEKRKRVTLTSKEISELFAESIITIILLIIVNIAILLILSSIINNTPALNEAIFESRNSFVENLDTEIFLSGKKYSSSRLSCVGHCFFILALNSSLSSNAITTYN
jgi:hypothetical protein